MAEEQRIVQPNARRTRGRPAFTFQDSKRIVCLIAVCDAKRAFPDRRLEVSKQIEEVERSRLSVITIIESEAIAIIEGRTKSAHGAAG
jgi:hypothetical protein